MKWECIYLYNSIGNGFVLVAQRTPTSIRTYYRARCYCAHRGATSVFTKQGYVYLAWKSHSDGHDAVVFHWGETHTILVNGNELLQNFRLEYIYAFNWIANMSAMLQCRYKSVVKRTDCTHIINWIMDFIMVVSSRMCRNFPYTAK